MQVPLRDTSSRSPTTRCGAADRPEQARQARLCHSRAGRSSSSMAKDGLRSRSGTGHGRRSRFDGSADCVRPRVRPDERSRCRCRRRRMGRTASRTGRDTARCARQPLLQDENRERIREHERTIGERGTPGDVIRERFPQRRDGSERRRGQLAPVHPALERCQRARRIAVERSPASGAVPDLP